MSAQARTSFDVIDAVAQVEVATQQAQLRHATLQAEVRELTAEQEDVEQAKAEELRKSERLAATHEANQLQIDMKRAVHQQMKKHSLGLQTSTSAFHRYATTEQKLTAQLSKLKLLREATNDK